MEKPTAEQGFSLVPLRRRREELRESMNQLELALAKSPAGSPKSWADGVEAALTVLSADFRTHIEITEGGEGLYQEILEYAPRLSDAVERLEGEHTEINRLIDELQSCVDTAASEEDVTEVRELGTTLLLRLVRHRQRGSDLVYDAFEFDIGGDT